MKTMRRQKISNLVFGFTLVETLVAVAIFTVIALLLSGFQRDIFFFGSSVESSLLAQIDARQVLRKFVSEARGVSQSSLGTYPVGQAATSSFVFYVDLDEDNLKERVRYFLDGTELKRGVIEPSGNPVSYSGGESISTVVRDVINGTTTPVFEYFNRDATATSSPLTYPLSISDIRLVRATVIIDKNPARPPESFTVTTSVMLRNLKDNL